MLEVQAPQHLGFIPVIELGFSQWSKAPLVPSTGILLLNNFLYVGGSGTATTNVI
jgi:hypothetical protein